MNQQLISNQSSIQPKKGHQRDPYVGQLHPENKKKHGKGNFIYPNQFFQYDGSYLQGKKHGHGILKLKDGTRIQANFNNDQIQGGGVIRYSDGSVYKGNLLLGQKDGKGIFQSAFQKYEGDWKQNKKQGKGKHQIRSTGQILEGVFKDNKLQGFGTLISYNYQYKGQWKKGKRQGSGEQLSLWRKVLQINQEQGQENFTKIKNYDSHEYKGIFLEDLYDGLGRYSSKISEYVYEGQFSEGLPINYPNQFRVLISSNVKNQNEEEKQTEKVVLDLSSSFEYELESDSKNIYVQCVYQGPQQLDDNQPTEQQIELLIKNWQNQNKKNKNPPPMPDFRIPKMKRPDLLLITEQNKRPIIFTLQSSNLITLEEGEGTNLQMKIDYRSEISAKRVQIQNLKQEQKKNQDQDPKKKGAKKQNKNQNQLKINVFKENPTKKQKSLKLETEHGVTCFKAFQLPDDFPQGKFCLTISSAVQDFGKLKPRRIQMLVKSKQSNTKKK